MNDGTRELITSNVTTGTLETFFQHWENYDKNVITKLKLIKIYFSGVGIDGRTFDWDYINETSAAESSKSTNGKESEKNSKCEKNSKTNSSDST